MATNTKKRKARKEFDRGYTAGAENRKSSGGIECYPSQAYHDGRYAATVERSSRAGGAR